MAVYGEGVYIFRKNDGLKHVVDEKYLFKKILYTSGGPKVPLKTIYMEPIVQS